MPLLLPLLAPAYYLCHYYYFYYQYYFYHCYYCCTCSTVPKHPEFTTDKSPRLHCRGTPLPTMTTSFSWTWLERAIGWTWWFKEWFGYSVSLTSLSLISTDQVWCPLNQHEDGVNMDSMSMDMYPHQAKAAEKLSATAFSLSLFDYERFKPLCGVFWIRH